jgi:hypothetical protein
MTGLPVIGVIAHACARVTSIMGTSVRSVGGRKIEGEETQMDVLPTTEEMWGRGVQVAVDSDVLSPGQLPFRVVFELE